MRSTARAGWDTESAVSIERITTAEAARRLGVSLTHVRRLIAAGRLQAEAEPRPQGRRLVVLWDAPHDTPLHATGGHNGTSQDATVTARLEDEVRWLRERLERAEEERAELRRMLNLEQQTVATLRRQLPEARDANAPDHATAPPMTPPMTPPAHGTSDWPTIAPRRRWWAVWTWGKGSG